MSMAKAMKWASILLFTAGFIISGIGFFCGGLDTANFLFWK